MIWGIQFFYFMVGETKLNIYGNWLLQGLTLASVPALAYFLAFLYERGYATFFHIPTDLIVVSPYSFCEALIGLIATMIVGFILYNEIYKIFHMFTYKYPRIDAVIYRWSTYLCIVFLILFLSDAPTPVVVVLLGVALIFLVLSDFVLMPVFRGMNKLLNTASQDMVDSLEQHQPLLKVERWFGLKLSQCIIGLLSLSIICFLVGKGNAKLQSTFTVEESSAPMVVLRVYGDTLVLAPVNKIAHQISPSFILKKVGADTTVVTVEENLGPLRPF